jgi:hypothetical protein
MLLQLPYAAQFLVCFLCAGIADVFWVLWANSTKPRKRWDWPTAIRAGMFAVALAVCGTINLDSWLHDKTFLIAIYTGMFSGTVCAVVRESLKLEA